MAEDPKAKAVGGKYKKRVEELGDKFEEVMGEPSTEPFEFWHSKTGLPQKTREIMKLAQPWWNLGEPSTEPFEAEPFGSPRRICPREPETPRNLKNLGGTFRRTF